MLVSNILRSKGSRVITVGPDCTILELTRTFVEHNIGAAVVEEGGQVSGIVSERDVLRFMARGPDHVAWTVPVRAVMTTELVTSGPEAAVDRAMHLLTENRIRHLPVMRRGRLAGIVSIGDLVNSVRSEVEETNRHLMAYISGQA